MRTEITDPAEFWEQFYGETREGRWSGRPNSSLVAEVAGLSAGSALELGSGEGGDAIWLAQQGWRVTAVDISAAALELAARHAAEAGVADMITWERRDLATDPPSGGYDLVTTSFLHSPVELPRTAILRAGAAAVAPGGTLLVVGHAPSATHPHVDLPAPGRVRDELALPADAWELVVCELRDSVHAPVGEEPRPRTDSVLRYRRKEG
jgi:SAM-dependent methyltransferase